MQAPGSLPIAADADFCITGTVDPDKLLPEGPFGDHLGYYSLAHPFPVLNVEHVWHRGYPHRRYYRYGYRAYPYYGYRAYPYYGYRRAYPYYGGYGYGYPYYGYGYRPYYGYGYRPYGYYGYGWRPGISIYVGPGWGWGY